VSTTYAILSIIIFPIMIIFIFVNPFIEWTSVFNAPLAMDKELRALMLVVFVFFCLKFVLQIFIIILFADQKPFLNNALNLVWNLVTLIIIFILTKTTKGSLFWLGTVISIVPVVVLIITSIYFFRHQYKDFAPSFKFIKFSYAKDLLSLGIQFFIMSLAGVVIFSSTNIIISQLYGTVEVTPYNIAYKYFSIITMVFSMAMVPFWSAFTDAFVRKEFNWIKSSVKKLLITWVLLFIFSILMLIFSEFFYRIWLGKIVEIPFRLSFIVFVYFIFHSLSLIFTSFLNGIGKIRLSLISAVVEAIIYIPLALLFSKYLGMGVAGIVLASTLHPVVSCLWMPIQYYKIINQKATGIWNK
jgi:O-antigen/teichoic acid export membrane protein